MAERRGDDLGPVLIRSGAHGDVALVHSSADVADARRYWPHAAVLSPREVHELASVDRAHLGPILTAKRWFGGALTVRREEQTP